MVGKWLESFKELAPRARLLSFSIDQVDESLMPQGWAFANLQARGRPLPRHSRGPAQPVNVPERALQLVPTREKCGSPETLRHVSQPFQVSG
jgi:hypothetical protein